MLTQHPDNMVTALNPTIVLYVLNMHIYCICNIQFGFVPVHNIANHPLALHCEDMIAQLEMTAENI